MLDKNEWTMFTCAVIKGGPGYVVMQRKLNGENCD